MLSIDPNKNSLIFSFFKELIPPYLTVAVLSLPHPFRSHKRRSADVPPFSCAPHSSGARPIGSLVKGSFWGGLVQIALLEQSAQDRFTTGPEHIHYVPQPKFLNNMLVIKYLTHRSALLLRWVLMNFLGKIYPKSSRGHLHCCHFWLLLSCDNGDSLL